MSDLRSVLSMILNALDRDAEDGKAARGEMAEELRAVLAQEAGPVVERQEPIAWAMQSGLERIERREHASHAVYGNRGQPGWDVPLYASQPAPVAVIVPERREPTPENPYLSDADLEWNACLDKVKELNQ